MTRRKITTSTMLLLIFAAKLFSCTTFIISGKYTPDGKPILFKNRDTKQFHNALAYFTDGKYKYIGLVSGGKQWRKMVWGGYNETGFAIINSAGCNNNVGDTSGFKNQEGIIMKLALQTCRTLQDFEKLLDKLKKPMGLDANFGVIDAYGGCAYYEAGNYDYKKYDANDPTIAPNGILVRTNYSKRGELEYGFGYCRYNTATEALVLAAASDSLTPQYLFNHVARNLTHSLTKTNLLTDLPKTKEKEEYRFFIDYIPRAFTVAAIMVVGAKNKEQAPNTMMWSILGFPLTSVAVPVWLKGETKLPKSVTMNKEYKSPMCNASLQLKNECFPDTFDRLWQYINFSVVINQQGNGIMQLLQPVENEIFEKTNTFIAEQEKGTKKSGDIPRFYKWLDYYLEESLKNKFGIRLFEK